MKKGTGIFVSVVMALMLLVAACAARQPAATPQPIASPAPTQAASPVAQTTPTPAVTVRPSPTPASTPAPAPTQTPGRAATPTPTPAATTAPATAPAPSPAPPETLGDVLPRAASIASVKYDMVMTSPGKPSSIQKVWLKKNKMRMELAMQGETAVNLIDTNARTMYTYMPSQNIAIKMDFSQAPQAATDTARSIEDKKPTVVGTEILDGKTCLVIEYSGKDGSARMWIWKQYGLPVRSEVTTAGAKVVMDYRNIEFSDIPDSTFELPAGVQVMSLPAAPPFPTAPSQPSGVPQTPPGMPALPAIPGLPQMPAPPK